MFGIKAIDVWIMLVAVIGGCGAGRAASPPQSPRIVMRLAFPKTASDVEVSRRKMVLTIINASPNAIKLDGIRLNPILLASIANENGQLVPKIPPPLPRAPTSEDVIELPSHGEHRITFAIKDITMRPLGGGPYTIRCRYKASEGSDSAALGLWIGELTSDPITIAQ